MDMLENVLIKWSKANDDAHSLLSEINKFCDEHPINLIPTPRDGRLGVNFAYDMKDYAIPLKRWSIDLGGIIYSLRSALDNLIFVCAQQHFNPPKKPGKLQFPIFDNELDFEARATQTILQLPEKIATLLKQIQPFQRQYEEGVPSTDPLILLNWMSNHDKHRMPIPFLVPPNQINLSSTCQFETEDDAKANIHPDITVHIDPIEHGNLFIEYKTKHPVVMIEGTVKIIAKVQFKTPFGNMVLADAIKKMIYYCALVINNFALALGEADLNKAI
ncbi:hypothetical protein [Aeromonas caviae]|uniref:hypothetical protein n=1 Tax=Aeromonas caviae TaxID=648 RepID=UPI002B461B0A|nr:hypothetical protein [Aeromonas caviae]